MSQDILSGDILEFPLMKSLYLKIRHLFID